MLFKIKAAQINIFYIPRWIKCFGVFKLFVLFFLRPKTFSSLSTVSCFLQLFRLKVSDEPTVQTPVQLQTRLVTSWCTKRSVEQLHRQKVENISVLHSSGGQKQDSKLSFKRLKCCVALPPSGGNHLLQLLKRRIKLGQISRFVISRISGWIFPFTFCLGSKKKKYMGLKTVHYNF